MDYLKKLIYTQYIKKANQPNDNQFQRISTIDEETQTRQKYDKNQEKIPDKNHITYDALKNITEKAVINANPFNSFIL